MSLDWPRGEYHFGPITIRANMIEPFIITDVFIGINPTEMYKIEFNNINNATEFIHMIDQFKDCPYDMNHYEELKKLVSDKANRDEMDRRKEYPPSRITKIDEMINDKPKKWWNKFILGR